MRWLLASFRAATLTSTTRQARAARPARPSRTAQDVRVTDALRRARRRAAPCCLLLVLLGLVGCSNLAPRTTDGQLPGTWRQAGRLLEPRDDFGPESPGHRRARSIAVVHNNAGSAGGGPGLSQGVLQNRTAREHPRIKPRAARFHDDEKPGMS